ncbi:rhodanese-like domain-containing protein [Tsuneonella mangrovi]|uniref:rhodanese-like domain-containing protein n=1 Tax=Tsuneonella mangrovi TaxID=1982042 RepID=UPI001F0A8482|nr:rhodanese-like domain-containing protein [Tsuneonella mangrovi]
MLAHRILLAAAASGALLLGGCHAEATAPAQHEQVKAGSVDQVDSSQLESLTQQGTAILVDVRSPEEFAAGHIAGAVNQPLESFDPAKVPQEVGKQTVLYCRTGKRSEIAAGKMAKAGEDATHLTGGIVAWEKAGLPIAKGE